MNNCVIIEWIMDSSHSIGAKMIIVFGVSELARVACHYLWSRGLVLTVDEKYIDSRQLWTKGLNVLPFSREIIEDHNKFLNGPPQIFLPIGYKGCNKKRQEIFELCSSWGWDVLQYIHPTANIAHDVSLGKGNYIQELVNIQTGVEIGDNNTFWGQAVHIGHSTTIGSHNWIASGTVISGCVKVGNNCFFGVNSCIRDSIEILDGTVVGMGAVITKSTPEPNLVYMAGLNNIHKKKSYEINI